MEAIWPRFVADVATIIAHSDVNITDPNGTEYGPEDDDEEEIPPPIVDADKSVGLNGVGSKGHEALIISCGGYCHHTFTKTLRKPYDDVVTCILLRAYMLASTACRIS